MADRIIKPDSGNDVVVQNNAGTRKIEVTNSGDVEVTGDFKTTTVKATNLKANDGTAGISIADSTGRVTFSENNPVITLGSNTTFGSGVSLANATFNTGQITNCKQWIDTSGNTTVNSNSLTALNESSASQNSFSATSGNSYLLSFTGTISIASDGSSVANRSGGLQLRYGTTAIADEETSLPDTTLAGNFKEFSDNNIGRNLIGSNSATATVYVPISLEFIFTASSTATHYFNLVGNAGNVRNMVMFKTTNNPLVTRYFEIQGDVTA